MLIYRTKRKGVKQKMDNVILVSIRKDQLRKIIKHEKTLEVRKNFPRIKELPCPILFYETLTSGGSGRIVAYGYLTGCTVLTAEQLKFIESRKEMSFEHVGGYIHEFMTNSCLSKEELLTYGQRKGEYINLYGWHVDEIHACNIPIEALGITRVPQSWRKAEMEL